MSAFCVNDTVVIENTEKGELNAYLLDLSGLYRNVHVVKKAAGENETVHAHRLTIPPSLSAASIKFGDGFDMNDAVMEELNEL